MRSLPHPWLPRRRCAAEPGPRPFLASRLRRACRAFGLVVLAGGALTGCDGTEGSSEQAQNVVEQEGSSSPRVSAEDAKAAWFRSVMAQAPPTAADYGPFEVQLGNATFAYLQQISTPADALPLLPPGIGGTVMTYSLFVEATQAIELFSLFVPMTSAGVTRPLLTAFHGYGSSHRDIDARTTFFEEAEARDWFLIAPLQRNLSDPGGDNFDINYGSAQSQLHVEAVIRFVTTNYSVDLDRLYAVGFSMGGGSAMSYAARHRDRSAGAFAAVVNHTGTVALADEHRNLDDGSIAEDVMETIFGGPPDGPTAFQWQRSSLIELKASGVLDPDGRHMARNLAAVPVRTVYNSSDALTHLLNQSNELDAFMQSLPGASHELTVIPGGVPDCVNQHCWGTLDEAAACNWLDQHTLNSAPMIGTYLIDRPGTWGYFEIDQVDEGKFSSVSFEVDALSNGLLLRGPENIGGIRTDLGTLGFSPASPIKLDLEGFDGTQGPLTIENLDFPPTLISRDGQVVLEDCSTNAPTWCYDAGTGTLQVQETLPAATRWRIDL